MRSVARTASKLLPALLSEVEHGSHLCAFYETKDDLIDLVVPFFSAGAQRNELCAWMMPDDVSAEEAGTRVGAVVAGEGIELHRARPLYMKEQRFEPGPVLRFWNEKLQQPLAASRSGMRVAGDTFWLQPGDWNAFLDYESDLNNAIASKPITLLCTFPLSLSKAGDIFEVARAHHFAIAKRKQAWEVIKAWAGDETPLWDEEKQVEAFNAANRILSLSRRERQVLDELMEGHYSKMIAHILGISVRTVEVHRAHMLNRLGVRTTTEAIRLATLARTVTQA